MKAQQLKTTSTQQQISDQPWVDCPDAWSKRFVEVLDDQAKLKHPNPPTPEAVARAQFVDKTYVWKEVSKEVKPT